MITSKQIKDYNYKWMKLYNRNEECTLRGLCWHCRFGIRNDEQCYTIILNHSYMMYEDEQIHFHTYCWETIAGEEYTYQENKPNSNKRIKK